MNDTMNLEKVRAESLKVGDVIMPPVREVQLWMRRHLQERGLSESALHLTVTDIREGSTDARGRWLVITTDHSPQWNSPFPFRFKARPKTPWPKVS